MSSEVLAAADCLVSSNSRGTSLLLPLSSGRRWGKAVGPLFMPVKELLGPLNSEKARRRRRFGRIRWCRRVVRRWVMFVVVMSVEIVGCVVLLWLGGRLGDGG